MQSSEAGIGKAPQQSGGPDKVYRLRLLATSDLHARIMPYDYAADRPLTHAGLACTASLIRTARAEALNSLTFDNGDFLEGEPLSELHALALERRTDGVVPVHPVIAAMNTVGYDAVTLGNHEFSYGIDFLQEALHAAQFPVLSANAVTRLGSSPTDDTHLYPPVLILERQLTNGTGRPVPIRVGLIGLLPPQIDIWESKHLAGRITTRDIVETAEAWVPHLRAEGADLIIALCHSGIGASQREERMENAAIPLARIEGLDVVIAGHTHQTFPGPDIAPGPDVDPVAGTICGKPALMMGFWGSHLGIVDLDLRFSGRDWSVLGAQAFTRAVPSAVSDSDAPVCDPAVIRSAASSHVAALAFVRQPVGVTELALHTYFAQVADSAALTLIHAAQTDWLAQALVGHPLAHLPMLSAASPFKSGDRGGPDHFTDIAPGPFCRRSLYDLYMYPNSIRALAITGRTLAEWLERSAARFLRLTPGEADQPLFDPEAPAYNFDTISGVSYAFDLSAPARYGPHGALLDAEASRLRDLRWQGRPVRPEDRFTIVTNSFRAAGGGGYRLADGTVLFDEPARPISEVIRDHVRRTSPVRPEPARNWRLTGLPPGTAAWFDTSPDARTPLGDPALPRIEPLATTPAGFLRCRLWF